MSCRVTIIEFGLSSVLNPNEEARQAGLESCSHLSIRNEMRKVKFLLDWKGAREKEFRLANIRSAREAKDHAVADPLMKSKTDLFEIVEEPKEPMSEEEKEVSARSKRNTSADIFIQTYSILMVL